MSIFNEVIWTKWLFRGTLAIELSRSFSFSLSLLPLSHYFFYTLLYRILSNVVCLPFHVWLAYESNTHHIRFICRLIHVFLFIILDIFGMRVVFEIKADVFFACKRVFVCTCVCMYAQPKNHLTICWKKTPKRLESYRDESDYYNVLRLMRP